MIFSSDWVPSFAKATEDKLFFAHELLEWTRITEVICVGLMVFF
ncbi:hypothetical protein VDG1235_3429 [Verrucomicrobiia bacterium DG1235]|nr:hypothetical protein VDG1235_3429 [Verrucomicrobiae bacterium DG1235]